MLASNAPGMFSYCQTAPADLTGSSWDTTVEGSQNFHDLDASEYYPGDTEDFVLPFGQSSPKTDLDAVDDFQARWTVAESKALKAEPMRRGTSHSSTVSSHRNRSSKVSAQSVKKPRPKVQTTMAQTSAFSQGRAMDVQQYLSQDLDTLSVSPQVNGAAFYSGLVGYPDGLPYPGVLDAMSQHVNPQIFDAGMMAASPHTWGSLSPVESRLSSPGLQDGADDMWSAPPSATSPGGSQSSPSLPSQSPRMTRKLDGSQFMTSDMVGSMGDDTFALPHAAFNSRRPSGEGESARDHPLYKNAFPQADGLFHCPWEGQANCNHKPEKLKCNYDKFVDSHLKPYRCKVDGCENARFSSTACLLRHEREAHAMHGHGEKPYRCTYEGCERSIPGHGFPRQWNLRDHMRRVHNDNGAAQPSSPPASGAATSTRGRKRKSDTQDKPSGQEKISSRKSSSKASSESSAPKQPEVVSNPEIDQWYEHQRALQTYIQSFGQPDDPQSLQYIRDAQEHLNAMGKISHGLVQGSQRRSWRS
ncbi:hypothetical protein VTJ83DRAFT_2531 [Remersonia thermophila]|uniref:C2H2-type domain-containing protein n=1 Tax=Remersonia thermophila TaxID=72144 RepID=A0ABR4DL99_9PEZI